MNSDIECVFAYGSNMDLEHLVAWCREHCKADVKILDHKVATLPDHKLIWNYHSKMRKGGAANITESAGSKLPGLLLVVSKKSLAYIDHKEGSPQIYSRGSEKLSVFLPDKTQTKAWVYKVVPAYCKTTLVPPHKDYLDMVLGAAKKHGLPDWHIAELEAIPFINVK